MLRSWDEAEARLFPLVMAQPELYQQALGAIQQLLGRLRETCHDLPALLAAHERGGDLLDDAGVPGVPGIRPALIAAAACATRYRELVALLAARRPAGGPGPGPRPGPALDGGGGERRAPNGRPTCPTNGSKPSPRPDAPCIVSIGPDETLSRAVYRLDAGQIDLASGALEYRRPARHLPRPRRVHRRPPPDPIPPRLAPAAPAPFPGHQAPDGPWLELLACLLLRRCIVGLP